jgi:U32 family peptidase
LKIEGRLKDAGYVAATTRAYRQAVDQAWKTYSDSSMTASTSRSALAGISARPKPINRPDLSVTKQELVQLFSRGQSEHHDGLSAGFLEGARHQSLVVGRSPRHRGIHIGRVAPGSSFGTGLIVALDRAYHERSGFDDVLKLGDGIVVDRGRPQDDELGGSVFDVQYSYPGNQNKDRVKADQAPQLRVQLGRDASRRWRDNEELVPIGAHVWKTSDAAVEKKMRRLAILDPPTPRNSVMLSVSGSIGAPLTVTLREVGTGRVSIGYSPGDMSPVERAALDSDKIRDAIGTLGNTRWNLVSPASDAEIVDVSQLDSDAWCPLSWVKKARAEAVKGLESSDHIPLASPLATAHKPLMPSQIIRSMQQDIIARQESRASPGKRSTRISVLARNLEQVDAVCRMVERKECTSVDEVIVDFLEVDGMRTAVERIRRVPTLRVVVASPRVLKPGESGIWRTLLRLQPDGLLVRSAGLLHRMNMLGGTGATVDVGFGADSADRGDSRNLVSIPALLGDFSLNAANFITALELLDCGLHRIAASYDLSAASITNMASLMGSAANQLEVIAHTKMPIFHTEHCVFARFLSKGDSYLNCGHVCTRHTVHLRDQAGADNLVLADMGCRNTVFSATSQSGVYSLAEWRSIGGIERIRIELVDESSEDSQRTVKCYHDVSIGLRCPKEVWEELNLIRDSNGRSQGVSLGSFRNNAERRAGAI